MKGLLLRATLVAGAAAAGWIPSALYAQGAARPAGVSVAVIDVSYVFKHFNRFNAQMDNIKKDIQGFEAFVRSKQAEIANEGEKLQQLKPGSPDYKGLEKQIADMQADLQVQMQLKRKEFLEAEARVYYNAYMEIVAEVARFAEQNGIGLVLRFNSEEIDPAKRETVLQGVNRSVVYQSHLNITDIIVDRLNRGAAPPPAVSRRTPSLPQRTR